MQFQTFVNWLQQLSVQYGYFGVFFVSLVSAALGVAVAIVMFRVDWAKHFKKLVIK